VVVDCRRAKEQVQNLNIEITAIENSGIYTALGYHEFERQRYVFRPVGPPVDVRIAVLTGEIVHHLWSVFDHIIWALATTSGLRYQQQITFPVRDSPEEFEKTVKDGRIQGVPSVAIPLIESFQPYRSSDPPNSLTRILYDLDRAEKHRLLIAAVRAMWPGNEITVGGGPLDSNVRLNLAIPPEAGPFHRGVENGEEILWLSYTTTTQPKWKIENDVFFKIAFEKIGPAEREPIVPVLVQLCNSVTGVINEFSVFFP